MERGMRVAEKAALAVVFVAALGAGVYVLLIGLSFGDPGRASHDIHNRRSDPVIVEITGTHVDAVVEAPPGRTVELMRYETTREEGSHQLRLFTRQCEALGTLVVDEWGWIDVPPEGNPAFHEHEPTPTPEPTETAAPDATEVPFTPEPIPLIRVALRSDRACTPALDSLAGPVATPFAVTPRPVPRASWHSPPLRPGSSLESAWPEGTQAWARVTTSNESVTLRSPGGSTWQSLKGEIPDDVRIVGAATGWAGSVVIGERDDVLVVRNRHEAWDAIDPDGPPARLLSAVVGSVPVVFASAGAAEDESIERIIVRVSAETWVSVDGRAAFGDADLVTAAAGQTTIVAVVADARSEQQVVWRSTDGLAWHRTQLPRLSGAAIEHMAAVDDGFVALTWRGGWEAWRVDRAGTEWEVIDPPDGLPEEREAVLSMAPFGDGLVAIGVERGGLGIWLAGDGSSWVRQQLPDRAPREIASTIATRDLLVIGGTGTEGDAVLIGRAR